MKITNILNAGGFNLQSIADTVNPQDAASFAQLNAAIQGYSWKQPMRAATTANITLSGTQTIDGVSLIASDRVLEKNQTTGSANGIYVVGSGTHVGRRANAKDVVSQEQTAGKNLIINGKFDLWQRVTTQATSGYGSADRWLANNNGTKK